MVENIFPDAVLMSLLMPVMDGITVSQAIRENHADIKGIPLTGVLEDSILELTIYPFGHMVWRTEVQRNKFHPRRAHMESLDGNCPDS